MVTPKILYHYCTTDSFVSIVRNKSIRLSSLSLSNDSMEGRLVKKTIINLAAKDGLNRKAIEELEDSLTFIEPYIDGLGFCLSAHGDLLSQWRGYADDGRGLSIGFGMPYLATLSENYVGHGFQLHEIKYRSSEHLIELEDTYRELRKIIDAGAFNRPSTSLLDTRSPLQKMADSEAFKKANTALMMRLLALAPKLYKLKSWAFREEREWRLVTALIGNTFESCEYRANQNRIIPFRTVLLDEMFSSSNHRKLKPIREVILGPKHETPPEVINAMLKQSGFEEVRVVKSKATYR